MNHKVVQRRLHGLWGRPLMRTVIPPRPSAVRVAIEEVGGRAGRHLNGPGDNPEMESFFGRLKTENRSLFQDADTMDELQKIVAKRIRYYNHERRHSTLGNQAPLVYVKSLTENR